MFFANMRYHRGQAEANDHRQCPHFDCAVVLRTSQDGGTLVERRMMMPPCASGSGRCESGASINRVLWTAAARGRRGEMRTGRVIHEIVREAVGSSLRVPRYMEILLLPVEAAQDHHLRGASSRSDRRESYTIADPKRSRSPVGTPGSLVGDRAVSRLLEAFHLPSKA